MARIPQRILDSIDSNPQVGLSELRIWKIYGDVVSVVDKAKTLLKTGRRTDIDTNSTTLARLGAGVLNETYVSSNLITHIASSSGSDTSDCTIEYHTVDVDGNFEFGVQTVTLAGQTKTPLATPAARVSRMSNLNGTAWVGDIYVAEDVTFTLGVPQTAAAIHAVVTAGDQKTLKAATTISSVDYWLMTTFVASIEKKTSASVDFELQVRMKGGLFIPEFTVGLSTSGSDNVVIPLDPHIIVPSNSDVRVVAAASTTSVDASAWLNGHLAIVIEG